MTFCFCPLRPPHPPPQPHFQNIKKTKKNADSVGFFIHKKMQAYVYIYIYIYTPPQPHPQNIKNTKKKMPIVSAFLFMKNSTYVCIYIYIYIFFFWHETHTQWSESTRHDAQGTKQIGDSAPFIEIFFWR